MTLQPRNQVEKTAYEKGGYRERYAMDNGEKIIFKMNGHVCYKYTYDTDIWYQDANGATFDVDRQVWIN